MSCTQKQWVLLDVHSQFLCDVLGGEGVRSVECGRSVASDRVRLELPSVWCGMRLFTTTYRGFIDVGRGLLDGKQHSFTHSSICDNTGRVGGEERGIDTPLRGSSYRQLVLPGLGGVSTLSERRGSPKRGEAWNLSSTTPHQWLHMSTWQRVLH
jgi:hypothetical protein